MQEDSPKGKKTRSVGVSGSVGVSASWLGNEEV
jgi:hypothetical protein